MTVLELAIVICVLGAGMALVLNGTVLIDSVRAFIAGFKIQQIQNRVAFYQNEYHHLPGDDPEAPRRYDRPESLMMVMGAGISNAGNEKLDGRLLDVLSPNGEPFMAWRDLRYAGLMDGDPKVAGAAAMPDNPFGGIYGFDEGNLGQTQGSLCLTNVPGRAAELIDRRLDDGMPGKGAVVATSRSEPAGLDHFDAPDSGAYNFEKTYIICVPLLP